GGRATDRGSQDKPIRSPRGPDRMVGVEAQDALPQTIEAPGLVICRVASCTAQERLLTRKRHKGFDSGDLRWVTRRPQVGLLSSAPACEEPMAPNDRPPVTRELDDITYSARSAAPRRSLKRA